MAENRFAGKERALKRLAALPDAIKEAVRDRLDREGADLVAAIKPVVPVSQDEIPGELRDSVEWHRNPRDDRIGVIVTEGYNQPNDPENRKARAVEFGRGGDKPAEAQPHFFPIYRSRKKGIRSRTMAAGRKVIRAMWGGPGSKL